jgi:hypothetical protein
LYWLNLGVLPLEDAKALLWQIAPRIGADEAGQLAALCKGLPLALRAVGSALVENESLKVADYVALLREGRKRLKPVQASLEASYLQLGPKLQERWRRLAIIPGTFDRGTALSVWEDDIGGEEAQEVLDKLVRYSVVEWNANRECYRIHDLARDYARSQMTPRDKAVEVRLEPLWNCDCPGQLAGCTWGYETHCDNWSCSLPSQPRA